MQKTYKNEAIEVIVDTHGAELISYKNRGREYVWNGDPAFWPGHAPILFPFIGSLKDGKVSYDGVEYRFDQKHGFASKSEFELVCADEVHAVFRLRENSFSKQSYPYDFELTVVHTYNDEGFSTTYHVKNTDTRPIQFCIGGHAGFMTPGGIENYKLLFEKAENTRLYHTDEQSLFNEANIRSRRLENSNEFDLRYEDFTKDAIINTGLTSRVVKLLDKRDGTGIEFDFHGFDVLTLWTKPGMRAPYICLEPWNGIPALADESGRFEDKPYRSVLDPGKEYGVGYRVRLIR